MALQEVQRSNKSGNNRRIHSGRGGQSTGVLGLLTKGTWGTGPVKTTINKATCRALTFPKVCQLGVGQTTKDFRFMFGSSVSAVIESYLGQIIHYSNRVVIFIILDGGNEVRERPFLNNIGLSRISSITSWRSGIGKQLTTKGFTIGANHGLGQGQEDHSGKRLGISVGWDALGKEL